MEIKVKEYDSGPQKSKAQVEEELLQKHEAEVSGESVEENKVEAVKVGEPAKAEEPIKEEPVVEEKPQMGEQEVLSFIREKYSKEVNSIDDLLAKREQEELPADVATYLQYKKETGRGFEDFAKISRDYSKESLGSYTRKLQSIDYELVLEFYSEDLTPRKSVEILNKLKTIMDK